MEGLKARMVDMWKNPVILVGQVLWEVCKFAGHFEVRSRGEVESVTWSSIAEHHSGKPFRKAVFAIDIRSKQHGSLKNYMIKEDLLFLHESLALKRCEELNHMLNECEKHNYSVLKQEND